MLTQTTSTNTNSAEVKISNKSQILSAAILGFVIMMGVGLSPMEVAHNAAHDTRHSFAFPCH
ncbi:MAG: CbtB domain-containing protein [Bermanella sp.]